MKAIISPTTASESVDIEIKEVQATISAGKLATSETVTFALIEDGVSSPGSLYQDGALRTLTATHNAMTIQGPIALRVTKSSTASAVGVYGINLNK
jgi:hypothetical protein